jgi:hypothetical protein
VLAALALLLSGGVRDAFAAGFDFIDDVLVAKELRHSELALELGADSRIDSDYRLQGWFAAELEAGITRRWIVEGVTSFVNRGRGLELGVWVLESRYLLASQSRWPVAVAVAAEYEVEERPAKHPSLERIFGARLVVTRTFAGSVLATVNAGLDWRVVPVAGRAPLYAAGVRYPEGRPVTFGFQVRREDLDHETRLGPEMRLSFGEMKLRLGALTGLNQKPYRFIARAILEKDL